MRTSAHSGLPLAFPIEDPFRTPTGCHIYSDQVRVSGEIITSSFLSSDLVDPTLDRVSHGDGPYISRDRRESTTAVLCTLL